MIQLKNVAGELHDIYPLVVDEPEIIADLATGGISKVIAVYCEEQDGEMAEIPLGSVARTPVTTEISAYLGAKHRGQGISVQGYIGDIPVFSALAPHASYRATNYTIYPNSRKKIEKRADKLELEARSVILAGLGIQVPGRKGLFSRLGKR